jgi:hypothetical protein
MRHPAGPIEALAFSADLRWLVSADGGTARVFARASGELVREIELEGRPLAIAVSADSQLVAIGDSAGNIYLAAPDRPGTVQTIRGRAAVTALAFGSSGGLLASGSSDGDLAFWDAHSLSAVSAAQRFTGAIRWIELAGDAGTVWLQSGTWLHRVDRSVAPPAIDSSRLLPELLRPAPALALVDGGLVRGLASRGGGRLALADVPLGPSPARDLLPDRDFGQVLQLVLDSATGAVQKQYP